MKCVAHEQHHYFFSLTLSLPRIMIDLNDKLNTLLKGLGHAILGNFV